MSDFFGISQAIKGVINVYFQCSRATGRSTSLLKNLKNGDRVIFGKQIEANRMRNLFKERSLEVECLVVPPKDNPLERGSNQGRTVFDHSWIEEFYKNALDLAQRDIEFLETNLSGYGEEHYKTKRKVIELSKWQ